MYIRRKVFSVVTDENGEEKLFSTTEFINENEYLENLSNEKYFSEDEENDGLSKKQKAAIATAVTAALATTAVIGGKKLKNRLGKKLVENKLPAVYKKGQLIKK